MTVSSDILMLKGRDLLLCYENLRSACDRQLLHVLAIIVWLSCLLGPNASSAATRSEMQPAQPSVEVSKLLRAQTAPLRGLGAPEVQRQRLAGQMAPPTLQALVMMCDFSDSLLFGRYGEVPGDFPPPRQTDRYYAAHDSLFFDHMMSKVSDYYTTVSGGKLTINYAVHPRVVNLPQPMGYYGNHPEEGDQQLLLAAHVVDSLSTEIDFTLYDTFIVVHAGAGEETDILGDSPEQIFSTYLNPDDFAAAVEDEVLAQPYLPVPGFPAGTGIDRVLILPETEQQDPIGNFRGGFGSLGVYCFEVGLHLGMLSLSDFTPSGRPDSQGIGQYGLMGYGLFVGIGFIPPHPCAYNKLLMGWIDPVEVDASTLGTYDLTPANNPESPQACVRVNITGQEFWLLEYRLQDPNGDRRYSFGDDKNGNGVPDFYDADSDFGDGTPTGKFDADTDLLERVVEAEWDFAMSENNARGFGELGWGSGVYVWHIDEGVVLDVFDEPRNLFNADPNRKAVDLEEADRIQDLDSREPSPFALGGDDDSFRGEFAHEFTPTTLPRTDTAGGAYTGIVFSEFSPVVADSFLFPLFVDANNDTFWAFGYADMMSFSLQTEMSVEGPVLAARRELPAGVDVRGSHVLLGDLDQLGATSEIILAGQAGDVFVLDGQLNEFLDHDSDPSTLAPFVVGTRAGEPAVWNLPPTMGDVDGDGSPEIILTADGAVYAFEEDGSAVRDGEAGSFGFYFEVIGCQLPPVLLPQGDLDQGADPSTAVDVLAVEQNGTTASLVFLSGGNTVVSNSVLIGQGEVKSAPIVIGDLIVTAVADTLSDGHYLHIWDRGTVASLIVPLSGPPSHLPLVAGLVPGADAGSEQYYVSVIDTSGRGETVFFSGELSITQTAIEWSADIEISSPLGLGGSFVGTDILGRVGHSGNWQQGWPRRPMRGDLAAETGAQGSPLTARLVGQTEALDQYIFATRDGRIMGTANQGESVGGWPLAGPATTAGTPALAQLIAGPTLDLVAIGTIDRITGVSMNGDLGTNPLSTISVWQDVAAQNAVWPMYGGSIWRNGSYDTDRWIASPGAASGTGLVSGSHYCYPSPLHQGPLKVSGRVRSAARAMVEVYNLAGELVRETPWQNVGAIEPFEVEIELPGVVSGLYLCRLVVDTPGAGVEQNVTQFAVVR